MLTRLTLSLATAATLAGPATLLGQTDSLMPTPDALVQRAWEAAGGLEAFGRLGIVSVEFDTEEVTTMGNPTQTKSRNYFLTPGPAPGRIEIEKPKVISGDDGRGGWALVDGKPDRRAGTPVMIKRLLATNLFTLMLPFSLNWEGVTLGEVSPTVIKGVPVWRLTVSVTRSFFHTPQIATTWRVDFDRKTYTVVQAEAPATDLGNNIKADGMRVSWEKRQNVQGVMLPTVQRTVGLSETGAEKPHWREQRMRYDLLEPDRNPNLFTNPIPPELRPTPPTGQPPVKLPSDA